MKEEFKENSIVRLNDNCYEDKKHRGNTSLELLNFKLTENPPLPIHAVSGWAFHKINTMAKRTKLTFEMINLDDDYIVDPNSIYINGWLPNWQMLDEFLFKKEDSNLPELIDNMKSGKMYQVELEIWVDSDDYRHWIDFKVLDSGLV